MRNEVWAIVLGAGSATRFGGDKQFALLRGARFIDRVVETARRPATPSSSYWPRTQAGMAAR